jgi:hypothetical protein
MSIRHRIGTWLIGVGQRLTNHAERRALVDRVAERLREEPKGLDYAQRAKAIAADELTKFYIETLRRTAQITR